MMPQLPLNDKEKAQLRPTRLRFEVMIEEGGEFNIAWGRFFKAVHRLRRVVLLEFARIGRAFRR